MKTITQLGLAATMILATSPFLLAQCGHKNCQLCGKKVCTLEVSEGTEDVTCYDVEAKEICIPGIKLPWECKRRCGGVRTICVLKPEKKERKVCEYDWSIKCICTTCCKQHGLKHGKRRCDICQDERVPFDYYAARPLPEEGQTLSLPTSSRIQTANTVASGPAAPLAARHTIAPANIQPVSVNNAVGPNTGITLPAGGPSAQPVPPKVTAASATASATPEKASPLDRLRSASKSFVDSFKR